MNLFIDTSNNKLILILEKDNEIIDSLIFEDQTRISDIAVDNLKNVLIKNNLTVHDLKNLYATRGPGSYTGVRVAVTIVKTLKTIDNNFKVYLISSLAFQAGKQKAISVLDARGGKVYMGVYNNFENIIQDQLIPLEYLKDFEKQFANFKVIKDYENIDFLSSYLETKNHFHEIENVEDIEPLYIKNFI